jgi:hypothetical protein
MTPVRAAWQTAVPMASSMAVCSPAWRLQILTRVKFDPGVFQGRGNCHSTSSG